MTATLARLVGTAIVFFARAITAVRALWQGIEPAPGQRVYFANHSSHGDFILVWAVLPPRLRSATRPVAGADYWLASAVRRFLGRDVFNAVLIARKPGRDTENPVDQMSAALDGGASLSCFPRARATRRPSRSSPSSRGSITSPRRGRRSISSRCGSRT